MGAGTEAAYVTVARVDVQGQLFCVDQHVQCGYTLKVGSKTFHDTMLADAMYKPLPQ